MYCVSQKLKYFKEMVKGQNKNYFGNIFPKKKYISLDLKDVQDQMDQGVRDAKTFKKVKEPHAQWAKLSKEVF